MVENTKLTFPECAKKCTAIRYFGVCECESICPWKFDNDGNPVSLKEENKYV